MAKVLLKIVGGEVIPEIEMLESATVLDLKEKIETILNVGVARQTLKFRNQVLMNDQTIGHWNFEQHASIVLCVKPLAGEPKFNISVENNYGEKTILKVRENTLVDEVKGRLDKEWLFSSSWLTLKHLSVEMDDDFPPSLHTTFLRVLRLKPHMILNELRSFNKELNLVLIK